MSVERIPTITFGDRLRRLRMDLHLSQDELGQEIGVSGATIGKYEVLPRPTRMARHVAASIQLRYGVPAEWMLTGSIPQGPSAADEAQVTHDYDSAATAGLGLGYNAGVAHTGNMQGYGAKLYLFPGRVKVPA